MSNIKTAINENINGATFVGISTSTTPTLKGGKSNPHQGRVKKIMTGANVMIFQNLIANGYENKVRRHLTNSGKNPDSFKLSPRAWGTRVEGTPFIEHKGNHYLEVIFLNAGKVHYTLDGQHIDEKDVQGIQYNNNGHQGGLEENDKVIIRTFKIDSITEITINGTTHTNLEYVS